jgi:Zn-finger nucleic acid-binding protein
MTDSSIHRGAYHCPNCGAAAAPESIRCAYCSSTLATQICASCYGAIFTGMKHCPWCGSQATAVLPVKSADLKCPRCSVNLMLVRARAEILHECESCGGLWLGKETLEKICREKEEQEAVLNLELEIERREPPGTHRQTRVYIPCPVCLKLMNRNNFARCSGIVIDWCKAHGTWLDRDELKNIVMFIQGGGLKKARRREYARLEEERRHLREEQRNLARLSRLADGSSFQMMAEADQGSFIQILSGVWDTLRQ